MHAGYVVPPYYDSMIGKLIVHQPTREQAIACMARALDECRVEGIATTIPFLRQIVRESVFEQGRMDTGFIARLRSS